MSKPLNLFLIFQLIVPIPIFAEFNSNFIQGKKAYEDFKIEEAVGLLEEAVSESFEQNINLKYVSGAYLLLALSYMTLEEVEKAENSFENLLKIDKNFNLDSSLHPPKVIEAFERVKKKIMSETKVRVDMPQESVKVLEPSRVVLPQTETVTLNDDFQMMKSFFEAHEEPKSNTWLWVGLGLVAIAGGVTYAILQSQNKGDNQVNSLPRATALRVRIP